MKGAIKSFKYYGKFKCPFCRKYIDVGQRRITKVDKSGLRYEKVEPYSAMSKRKLR